MLRATPATDTMLSLNCVYEYVFAYAFVLYTEYRFILITSFFIDYTSLSQCVLSKYTEHLNDEN